MKKKLKDNGKKVKALEKTVNALKKKEKQLESKEKDKLKATEEYKRIVTLEEEILKKLDKYSILTGSLKDILERTEIPEGKESLQKTNSNAISAAFKKNTDGSTAVQGTESDVKKAQELHHYILQVMAEKLGEQNKDFSTEYKKIVDDMEVKNAHDNAFPYNKALDLQREISSILGREIVFIVEDIDGKGDPKIGDYYDKFKSKAKKILELTNLEKQALTKMFEARRDTASELSNSITKELQSLTDIIYKPVLEKERYLRDAEKKLADAILGNLDSYPTLDSVMRIVNKENNILTKAIGDYNAAMVNYNTKKAASKKAKGGGIISKKRFNKNRIRNSNLKTKKYNKNKKN